MHTLVYFFLTLAYFTDGKVCVHMAIIYMCKFFLYQWAHKSCLTKTQRKTKHMLTVKNMN